jgi:hypothetical protein
MGLLVMLTCGALLFGGLELNLVPRLLISGLPLFYALGLIPALLAAVTVGLLQRREWASEIVWVVLIGFGIGVLAILSVASLAGSLKVAFDRISVVYILTCLIPTLACWFLSRGISKLSS